MTAEIPQELLEKVGFHGAEAVRGDFLNRTYDLIEKLSKVDLDDGTPEHQVEFVRFSELGFEAEYEDLKRKHDEHREEDEDPIPHIGQRHVVEYLLAKKEEGFVDGPFHDNVNEKTNEVTVEWLIVKPTPPPEPIEPRSE